MQSNLLSPDTYFLTTLNLRARLLANKSTNIKIEITPPPDELLTLSRFTFVMSVCAGISVLSAVSSNGLISMGSAWSVVASVGADTAASSVVSSC